MSKFPYYIPVDKVYKPWIPIRLGFKHKITTAPIIALVDSGADVCLCSIDIGIWLGINFKKKSPFSITGVNGQSMDTFKEICKIYFDNHSFQIPIYFSGCLPKPALIILGQLGFFDHFKVTFDLKNKEIEII